MQEKHTQVNEVRFDAENECCWIPPTFTQTREAYRKELALAEDKLRKLQDECKYVTIRPYMKDCALAESHSQLASGCCRHRSTCTALSATLPREGPNTSAIPFVPGSISIYHRTHASSRPHSANFSWPNCDHAYTSQ